MELTALARGALPNGSDSGPCGKAAANVVGKSDERAKRHASIWLCDGIMMLEACS